jgi:hypothetical protein
MYEMPTKALMTASHIVNLDNVTFRVYQEILTDKTGKNHGKTTHSFKTAFS